MRRRAKVCQTGNLTVTQVTGTMGPFGVFRPWKCDVDSASVAIEVGERIVLELPIQVGLHEERVTCLETNSELKGLEQTDVGPPFMVAGGTRI